MKSTVVVEFEIIYQRICKLAPSEDKSHDTKERFYDKKCNIRPVIIGGKSKHMKSKESGRMMIGFAQENDVRTISTSFDH